jgi:hypothetical protein
MFEKFLALVFLSFCFMSCSHTSTSSEGSVTHVTGPQTFLATYPGEKLKIGDRVILLEEKGGVVDRRNPNPQKSKKTIIGSGTVTSDFKNNFYEMKSDSPQMIPEKVFIQKL